MTNKVLKENPGYTEGYIRKQLEEAFGCEVVLIPWDRYEMFGHADGMAVLPPGPMLPSSWSTKASRSWSGML